MTNLTFWSLFHVIFIPFFTKTRVGPKFVYYTITRIEQYHLGSIMQLPIYMASYATPVIHV